MIEVRKTAAFVDWLDALRDVRAKVRIIARLLRAEAGNLGDVKAVGDGMSEMRVDVGAGPGLDLDFLKSRDAALSLPLAERIAARDQRKRHLVFAPARFVPQKKLLELGVEHAPLPYALYRIEKA